MALTANMRGAALMTGSMTAFTVNDTFVKLMGEALPLFQVMALRGVAVVVLFYIAARRAGALARRVPRGDHRLMMIRTAGEVGAAYFFLSALFNMPIANATAILQALPLTVALGAALILREPVGWRRFAAIGVGFLGVFLILRPGADGFNAWSLYAVAAVICVTIRDLAVRRMSLSVPSLTIALHASVGILVLAIVGALFTDWQPMAARHWAYLGGSVIFVMAAYLFGVMTMRVGDIGFVSPFRYTSLIAALVTGLLVFGEWPDQLTLIGAAIVVATGIYTLWRERIPR